MQRRPSLSCEAAQAAWCSGLHETDVCMAQATWERALRLELQLFDEGVDYLAQTDEIERLLEQALEQVEDGELLARVWLLRARVRYMRGDIAEAVDSFEHAAEIAEEAGLDELALLARAHANANRVQLGGDAKLEAYEVEDPKLRADLLWSETTVRNQAGYMHDALRTALQAQRLYEAADNLYGVVVSRTSIAMFYLELGRYDDAIRTVEAVDAQSHERFEHLFAYRRMILGRTLGSLERYPEAHECLRQARDLYRRLENELMVALTDMWEANCNMAEGHFGEAASMFERAHDGFVAIEYWRGVTLALSGQALACQLDGQADRALGLAARIDRGLCSEPTTVAIVDLRRGQMAQLRGPNATPPEVLLEAARSRTGPDGRPMVETCEGYRQALSLFEQTAPSGTSHTTPTVLIAPDFSWIETEDARFELPGGHKVRTLLSLVFEERQRNPGGWVTIDAVCQALWPGERMRPTSRTNRLNVMISRLRRLGIGKRLERSPKGLRLDPTVGFVIGG